jgi:glutamine synthetase
MNIFEYIWLDGNGLLRSKGKVTKDAKPTAWNFDGSSTGQATTSLSEITLFPVKIIKDPFRKSSNSFLVLCSTNWIHDTRQKAQEIFAQQTELEPMFGLEQEFFMVDKNTNNMVNWAQSNHLGQGTFYCGIGTRAKKEREFIETVLSHCLYAEIPITGYNFEVAIGQAEFQVCDIGVYASDNLFLLRFIMERVGEEMDIGINYTCKPLGECWNGSGMHCNFSTKPIRDELDAEKRTEMIIEQINKLSLFHKEALQIYGKDNHLRLTGKHETSSMDKFTYGFGSRDTSVRIPTNPENRFYFEDRRPTADSNPYETTSFIFKTCCLN